MRAATTTACLHCGTPFRPAAHRPEFCCAGCQFVHHLLNKRGLAEFYNYRDRKAPAGSFVFHERDAGWIQKIQESSEEAGGAVASATLDIQGISCAGCVWLLERVFLEHPGAVACRVNASRGTLRLEWSRGACDLAAYAEDVRKFGYLLGPAEAAPPASPLVRKLGLCGALALNAMLFALPRYLGLNPGDRLSQLFDVISLAIATASILIGGGYFFRRAAGALNAGTLHIDLPISLGLLVAYAGSCLAWIHRVHTFAYFDFVSIFTFLMLLGRWTQERAVERNRRRLSALRISPGKVRSEGAEISAEAVSAGIPLTLGKGDLLPVRSRLVSPQAVFALGWITGEPAPGEFLRGSIVPAGARHLGAGDVELEALEPWTDSQLASLMRVESGTTWRNAAMHRLISAYLFVVLVAAAAGFALWGLLDGDWIRATQVLVSVLVVSCPCAIGVALPLLDDLAAAGLQRAGIYIREGSLWPRLRRVTAILLDKTGTVTLETLALSNPESLQKLSPAEQSALLRIVGTSLHPVAACLRETLLPLGIEPASGPTDPIEHTGCGIKWVTPEGTWKLGRCSWAGGSSSGTTALVLEGRELASFSFREEPRPGAEEEIHALQEGGRRVYLLSGDEGDRVRNMGRRLGIPPECAMGNLSPQDKASLVEGRWNGCALMVGDGANDSLAFDAALCRGTPAVDTGLLEHKADFYMPGSSLAGLSALFETSQRHSFATRAVFGFAITYNAAAVAASLAGLMNPLVAAVIMPLSSLTSIAIVLAAFQHHSKPNEQNHGNNKPKR